MNLHITHGYTFYFLNKSVSFFLSDYINNSWFLKYFKQCSKREKESQNTWKFQLLEKKTTFIFGAIQK